MADHSFDIESKYSKQELINSLELTKKELLNRYDFKDSKFEIEFKEKEHELLIVASSDYHLKALLDTLMTRSNNRGISPSTFDTTSPVEQASSGSVRQKIKLVAEINSDVAKEISKLIRDNFKKAKVQIQGGSVRVVSPSIDDLQAIMSFIKEAKTIKIPLQFENYR